MSKPTINLPIFHNGAQVGLASIVPDMVNQLNWLMKEKFNILNCQPFAIAGVFKTDLEKLTATLMSLEIFTEMTDYKYFNEKEMRWLRNWFTEVRDCVGDFDYYKNDEMSPEEWNAFKEKIT